MPRSKQSMRKLRERAQAELEFFKADTLSRVNEERSALGFPVIEKLTYAIEGKNDKYRSEILLAEKFKCGLSIPELQTAVVESGSSCVVSDNEEQVLEALVDCLKSGNSDMSLYDTHRNDGTLLYVTWTDMPE